MAIVQLRRASFARATLMRDSVSNLKRPSFLNPNGVQAECKWCGQKPRTLYCYAWEDDGIYGRSRMQWSPPFCNVACADSYGFPLNID